MERLSKRQNNDRYPPKSRWDGRALVFSIRDHFSGYLGSAMVLFVSLTLLALWIFWYRPAQRWTQHRTDAAQTLRVRLPDGSAVRLNGSSSVRYEKDFARDRRAVYVTGQAYFEIAADPRPFVVVAGKAEAIALGTGIGVRQSKNKIQVYVPDGRALFFSGRGDTVVTVKNGQTAMCLEGGFVSPPRSVDRQVVLGWLEGRLEYRKTPLCEVITDLERGYGAKFRLTEPGLAWNTVNARFKGEDLVGVLEELCEKLELTFRFGNGTWILSPKDSKPAGS